MTGKGAGGRIFRASLAVMAAHVIFKLASTAQSVLVIPRVCSPETQELFTFAFDTVLMAFYLIGEEGLGPAFLPVFMAELDKRGEKPAWSFANTLITVQALLLLSAAGAVMLFPESVVALFTDWNGARPEAFVAKAASFVRWSIPALFCLSVGSTTYLLLNGYKRFFLAALGDASVKFMVIALAVTGWLAGGDAMPWLCAGVVLGSVAKVVTHLVGLRGEIGNFRFRLDVRSPAFKALLLLILPLLAGIVFAKVRDIFNDSWVLSQLPENLLRVNKAGKRLFQTLGWLVPYGVSIAMYPFFCELVDKDDREKLSRLVDHSARLILVLMAPVCALVCALALPMTRQLYQNANFDLHACAQVALSTLCYTLVLPFFAVEFIFMQAFFSNRRMVTPTLIGVGFSCLSMALCYIGVVSHPELAARLFAAIRLVPAGDAGTAALSVVALSFTLCRVCKVVALGGLMKHFLPGLKPVEGVFFALRLFLSALACGGTAYGLRLLYEARIDTAGSGLINLAPKLLPELALGVLAGLAAYALALRLLCPGEWRETWEWTAKRLRRGKE